ncbi:Ig-like domain-containing protein [Leptospira sp. 'Mane']|uniref:Ig-like domain-containing protein n=1 Tax=Leptospira sp. 'Mane' TaxID=3387407 RepID=UPI00398B8810
MNTLIAKTSFIFRPLIHISCVLAISFISNCYFNPAIQSIVNPVETKSSSGLLAVLGLGGGTSSSLGEATLRVSGQLKSDGLNLINGNLTVSYGGSSSLKGVAVSATTTTNSVGKFVLSLKPGTPKISVSDSNGADLGSFTLNVPTEGEVTQKSSDPSLALSGLKTYTLTETPDLTTDDTASSGGASSFQLVSSIPANGATGVALSGGNAYVELTFNNKVDPSTINTEILTVLSNGSAWSASNAYLSESDAKILNIVIVASKLMTYSITIPNTVKDIDGNFLTQTTIGFTSQ